MPPYDEEIVEALIEDYTMPELRCSLSNRQESEALAKAGGVHPHIYRACLSEAIRRLEEGAI